MKSRTILMGIILSTVFVLNSNAQQDDFPVLEGPYLGQRPPGLKPEIFAPGIVSTESHEFSCCFSPDGKEFYFTRRHPGLNQTVVMESKRVDGIWTKPDVAPFVENEFSFEPSVTPDNKRLYFQSGKPIPEQTGLPMNVLYVERQGTGWGKPINPGPPFNPAKAMHISATHDGTIYTTDISNGPGSERLGLIKPVHGEYLTLEKLGDPFNKEKQSMHPWIAPDESYILFGSRRPAEEISNVLFYACKLKNGDWSEPIKIELGMIAGQPFVTHDGKYLFFTSGERGEGDIYWVDANIFR